MRDRKYQRPGHRKRPVCGQSQLRVREGSPGYEQYHAKPAGSDNAQIAMTTKT